MSKRCPGRARTLGPSQQVPGYPLEGQGEGLPAVVRGRLRREEREALGVVRHGEVEQLQVVRRVVQVPQHQLRAARRRLPI